MKHKSIVNKMTTHVVVFETGDDVLRELRSLANSLKLKAAHFTGIGALSEAELGFFDLKTNEYKKIPVTEQVEVLALTGNISIHEGLPKIHAHIVLGKSDGSVAGGHFLGGKVRPTLELFIHESEESLNREMNEKFKLPLIAIEN